MKITVSQFKNNFQEYSPNQWIQNENYLDDSDIVEVWIRVGEYSSTAQVKQVDFLCVGYKGEKLGEIPLANNQDDYCIHHNEIKKRYHELIARLAGSSPVCAARDSL